MINIVEAIRLLRPQQWLKNGFVFLPMFFGGQLLNEQSWIDSIITFVAFSFVASAVYCLNDIKDIEADRFHPRKCKRPLASGNVTVIQGISLLVLSLAISFSIALSGLREKNVEVALIVGLYFVLNVAYCLKLKQYAIIDVFIVSFGFVLRVVVGGVACSIWLSPWIITMTFLLSLFLAFAKRRDDVVLHQSGRPVTRPNTLRYNLDFLNQVLGILASVTIVSYIIYTVQDNVIERMGSEYIYVSAIFVLAGILRYLQLAIVDSRTGSPTKVLCKDRFIHLCIAGWIATFFILIYLL